MAERLPDGATRLMVAIADVDAFVPKHSAIDGGADRQTMTVYAGVRNFPMLPEPLSTAATSLQEAADRLAIVVEFVVGANGQLQSSDVYRAVVRNTAQLTYDAGGEWLEGRGPAPPKVAAAPELQAQLRLQETAAQALRNERYRHDTLNIETIETRPVMLSDAVVGIEKQAKNLATELTITLRISRCRSSKLMGPGEYVPERPGDPEPGHFGLAVEDYTHSTAPNRRFADLVTQRLVKALLSNRPAPYDDSELSTVALHCTTKGNAARKVERAMSKRIAAVAMSSRIGELFNAIVTGVTPIGTFVRIMDPRVEGLLAHGQQGADVGDRLRVRLVRTDPDQGFIDFARA